MKQLVTLILCVSLSSILLVSCGQAQPAATAFISTDATTLMFVNWQPGDNHQISGQWYQVMYTTPYTQAAQAQVSSVPIAGTLASNGQVTIQSSGITLYTGTQKGDSLDLNGVNSQGQTQTTHWYSAERATYDQLVRVFDAHMETRVRLAILNDTLNLLPVDSDPATANALVQGTKSDVDFLQATWNDDVPQTGSQAEKCAGLQAFLLHYPYRDTFTAPDASKSTLATQIAQVQTQWSSAQQSAMPALPTGITLPWKLTQQQVSSDLKPAQQALTHVQTADQNAKQPLAMLKTQYDTLATQVEALKQAC